ncbi:MAG: Rrf2 family transcriptional regulator [Alphaproteobacteria bacterium]|jgi:Rrf2 family protein
MPVLSRRGRLAIAAVVDIAVYSRQAPVAAKALASRHNLPPRHLEPLLQALVRAGILRGLRGPRGGYELARERKRVSCGDIVRAAMVLADEEPEALSPLVSKIVVPAVIEAEQHFHTELDKISIDTLCQSAEALLAGRQRVLEDA